MKIKCLLFCAVSFISINTSSAELPEARQVEDIIPLTVGNIRGHKMLYNEGYSVIVSSRKAFSYAREKSITSSRTAIMEAVRSSADHSVEYKEEVKGDVMGSVKTGKGLIVSGTEQTVDIIKETHAMSKKELAYAGEGFQEAWNAFVKGNINIGKRTESERKELASLPGNYFRNLKGDFSNLLEITSGMHERISGKVDAGWDKAFNRASQEFKGEYEKSGEESNSLAALGHILFGYLKALYQGAVVPTSKTIVKTGSAGVSGGVFLPVAATTVVAGRTVQAAGLTVYYVGKTGVKVVSPTIEGGLLTSLSLLSLGAVPVTYVGGTAVGAVNQVAFTTGGPVYGASQAAVSVTADTAKYVGFLAYDGIKGTTRVFINQAQSGVVLGYHALTAIPAHLLMGTIDGAIFLAYDGPRLVIAYAKGEIRDGKGQGYSAGDLPVGTVVDLNRLQSVEGMKVEVLSDDPGVIRDAIEKLPCDLREEGAACE